jgi:hypothetical protein
MAFCVLVKTYREYGKYVILDAIGYAGILFGGFCSLFASTIQVEI